jgi:Lon protease-like protein
MAVLELPIFPLPLVLFPGAPQLLHIFEPRYRQMLADCMDGDRRFGVSWVEAEPEQDPSPEAGSVGCVAYVRARTGLPDGRSNILTVGEDRYTIVEYLKSVRPYRIARVETFDDDPQSADGTTDLCVRVGEIFKRFTAALSALSDAASAAPDMSDDPKALSFQVAATLEIDGHAKQELLIVRSIRQRLESLERLLRAATEELGPRAEIHVRARRNGKGGGNAAIVGGT